MSERQIPGAPHERPLNYLILIAETPEELQVKVCEKLHSGTYALVGQPFVYKERLCQTISLRYG